MATPVQSNATQPNQPIHSANAAAQLSSVQESKPLQTTQHVVSNYTLPTQNQQSSYGVSIPPSLELPVQGLNIDQTNVHAALQALFEGTAGVIQTSQNQTSIGPNFAQSKEAAILNEVLKNHQLPPAEIAKILMDLNKSVDQANGTSIANPSATSTAPQAAEITLKDALTLYQAPQETNLKTLENFDKAVDQTKKSGTFNKVFGWMKSHKKEILIGVGVTATAAAAVGLAIVAGPALLAAAPGVIGAAAGSGTLFGMTTAEIATLAVAAKTTIGIGVTLATLVENKTGAISQFVGNTLQKANMDPALADVASKVFVTAALQEVSKQTSDNVNAKGGYEVIVEETLKHAAKQAEQQGMPPSAVSLLADQLKEYLLSAEGRATINQTHTESADYLKVLEELLHVEQPSRAPSYQYGV
jgi:hypothetical protein